MSNSKWDENVIIIVDNSQKLLCNFIEITPQHGCSFVNLLHISRTLSYKNTSGGLLPNSSLEHSDNEENHISVLDGSPTQELDDTTITAEAKYSINITKLRNRIYLTLHYNESNNSTLYANGIKINQFKVKDPILSYPLCLLIFLKNFTVDNMKKSGLNRNVFLLIW